jgi:hypothetical protein
VGGWGHGAAAVLRGRLRPIGVVAREVGGRLRPVGVVVQEAGGRLQPASGVAWHGRSVPADRDYNWHVAKPSTKVLNVKKNTNLYVV